MHTPGFDQFIAVFIPNPEVIKGFCQVKQIQKF